jgi:Mg-chelatase subunit ChlD
MRLHFIHILLVLLANASMAQNVKWEQTTVNFGTVKDWNSPAATYSFQNTGSKDLMLLPQRHERDVLVRYPNRSIRPGEVASITIQYYTGETGSFSRTVEVYSNASDKPVKLTVKGSIKSIYADALTQCPSFQTTTPNKSDEPNVIQVVDRRTDRPIPGAQVEIYDRGIRKAVNGTNLDGVAVNWVEAGKYIAIAYKEGYEKGEEEISFSKRNRSHIVYLDRKSREPIEPAVVLEDRPVEEEVAPIQEVETEEFDLGISLNDQIENEEIVDEPEFDLGVSTNNQWEDEPTALEEIPESVEEPEESFDLGISLNEQIAEEVPNETKTSEEEVNASTSLSTSLGITTNEVLEEEILVKTEELNVEELVEAALTEAEPSTEIPEPEFSSEKFKPNNVLLLIDVSGSMKDDDKMAQLKKAVRRMIMMLREVDVLTLIAYNSSSWEVLPPTPVKENEAIVALIDSLEPTGYTNGVKGMESAYASLFDQLIPGGNNQLIIATDGKFNSSKFSEKDAIQLVKSNSDKGIVLSIIGFGEDREATRLMRKLAKEGNGSFMQINKGENPTELLAEEIKSRSRKY